METRIITEENTRRLLDRLAGEQKVIAPFREHSGDMYLQQMSGSATVSLGPFKPPMPAVRELLFGQVQEMISYGGNGEGLTLEMIDRSGPALIFGLPGCDVNGILYCDTFFGGREYNDPYYRAAREKLTLISMVCDIPPRSSCFCGSMTGGPHIEQGFDLQLTPLKDSFFVEIGTEKGSEIVLRHKTLFAECTAVEITGVRSVWDEARRKTTISEINKEKTLEKMARAPVKKSLFTEVSDRCISCGACNYTCPTCTCFNVVDWGSRKEGIRKRILDSCIFSGYFRIAGGHNPRARHEARTKQRYYCKLIWDKEKFNDSGCVGCGRCLDSCPVDIDIKEVMKSIAAQEEMADDRNKSVC